MKRLLALHEIAAQRGDGLRPELAALFESARPAARIRDAPASTGDRDDIAVLQPEGKRVLDAGAPHHAARLPAADK